LSANATDITTSRHTNDAPEPGRPRESQLSARSVRPHRQPAHRARSCRRQRWGLTHCHFAYERSRRTRAYLVTAFA
jgi:hypothetical protein